MLQLVAVPWEDDPAETHAARLVLIEAASRLAEWNLDGAGERTLAGPAYLREFVRIAHSLAGDHVFAGVEEPSLPLDDQTREMSVKVIRMLAADVEGLRPTVAIASGGDLGLLRNYAGQVVAGVARRRLSKRRDRVSKRPARR